MKSKKIQIAYLLRPHWKALTIAFIAVIGVSFTDLLEPWPLKVVFDYVLGSKPVPEWISGFVNSTFGHDKLAILNFAAIAVITIAVVGAISSYTEDYLTTTVGQWVMHDLRRTLYHHIQRLSLAYHVIQPLLRLVLHSTTRNGRCYIGRYPIKCTKILSRGHDQDTS